MRFGAPMQQVFDLLADLHNAGLPRPVFLCVLLIEAVVVVVVVVVVAAVVV